MKILKIVLILLAILFAAAQFIRPPKNDAAESHQAFLTQFSVPADVQEILRNSCFDCHSNTTRYPWYAEIQPAGWFLNDHITEGKKHLNLSEFGTYRVRRQHLKFEEIVEMVEAGEMPLPTYTLIHWDAKLSTEQQEKLTAWAKVERVSLEGMYPDSLGM